MKTNLNTSVKPNESMETPNMTSAHNQPLKKFSAGAIVATVWNNQTKDEESEYNTISLERNYKDKEGNWKSTSVMRTADIPKATLVLGKAYEYLSLKPEL